MDILAKFKLRAENSLQNPEELSEENLNLALEEALEAVANKDIAEYITIDIAYFRLLLICKVSPSDDDYKMYERSLRLVKEANEVLSESETNIKVETRKSLWL